MLQIIGGLVYIVTLEGQLVLATLAFTLIVAATISISLTFDAFYVFRYVKGHKTFRWAA